MLRKKRKEMKRREGVGNTQHSKDHKLIYESKKFLLWSLSQVESFMCPLKMKISKVTIKRSLRQKSNIFVPSDLYGISLLL